MKALSSARIRQYDNAVEAIGDFERTIDLGLKIVLRTRDLAHSPKAEPSGCGMIVIGPDRGLCGRFNDRISDFAVDRLKRASSDGDQRLCVLGQRAAVKLELAGCRSDPRFALPGSVGGLADTVRAVAVQADRWTHDAGIGRVMMMFNRRVGVDLAEPTEWQLLPLCNEYLENLAKAAWPSRSLPTYRRETQDLFSRLIGQRMFVML